jgi:hypothetical protein
MQANAAWPFLVAAGRRRDYSILLAPDFLVADLDYGVLEEIARPSDDSRPTVVAVRTRTGRRLTVVHATHLLTAADLEPDGAYAASPSDEYGRPLRLIYGFVSHDRVVEPSAADLRTAFDAALVVYRRFLDDEDVIAVAPGHAYLMRSLTHGTAPVPVMVPVSVPAKAPRVRRPVVLAASSVAVIGAIAAGVMITTSRGPILPPCPVSSAVPSVDPSPAFGLLSPSPSPTHKASPVSPRARQSSSGHTDPPSDAGCRLG